jgi:hypothetical protein
MPRRSGTTTVWSFTSTTATGAHMSPVSPKRCSMTTAGPLPPGRMSEVARRLQIGRSTLYRKLEALGLNEGRGAANGEEEAVAEARQPVKIA